MEDLRGNKNAGYTIIDQRPDPRHEHLSYVLAVKWDADETEAVTWYANHSTGGYAHGHYFHVDRHDNPVFEAAADLQNRAED